eukprot:jgi/Psemu1/45127/gm1.45127_g
MKTKQKASPASPVREDNNNEDNNDNNNDNNNNNNNNNSNSNSNSNSNHDNRTGLGWTSLGLTSKTSIGKTSIGKTSLVTTTTRTTITTTTLSVDVTVDCIARPLKPNGVWVNGNANYERGINGDLLWEKIGKVRNVRDQAKMCFIEWQLLTALQNGDGIQVFIARKQTGDIK